MNLTPNKDFRLFLFCIVLMLPSDIASQHMVKKNLVQRMGPEALNANESPQMMKQNLVQRTGPESFNANASPQMMKKNLVQRTGSESFNANASPQMMKKNLSTNNSVQSEDVKLLILETPIPEKCASRPKHFRFGTHTYFLSSDVEEFSNISLSWLRARNFCRQYCMDLISLEGPREDTLIKAFIRERNVKYIWTSGRLCNFEGCDREDLQPAHINGWFWSGSSFHIAPTNQNPPLGWTYRPWSHTGHTAITTFQHIPQPDNAEYFVNESVEACLGILNNIYNDNTTWHDVACYHQKPFICEDSDLLLNYVRSIRPDLELDYFNSSDS